VKRAEPDEAGAPFFEMHKITHHFLNAGSFQNLIDGFLWDHARKLRKNSVMVKLRFFKCDA
jgi:hypothetical protein